MTKNKKQKESKVKTRTLFDHVNAVFSEQDPEYFKKITDGDKKTWSNYMLNRFLSMQPNYVEIVNLVQRYSSLPPHLYYSILIAAIPKTGKQWNPYIKSKNETKFEPWLVDLFSNYFEVKSIDAIEYLKILSSNEQGKESIKNVCKIYGKDPKEINKLDL